MGNNVRLCPETEAVYVQWTKLEPSRVARLITTCFNLAPANMPPTACRPRIRLGGLGRGMYLSLEAREFSRREFSATSQSSYHEWNTQDLDLQPSTLFTDPASATAHRPRHTPAPFNSFTSSQYSVTRSISPPLTDTAASEHTFPVAVINSILEQAVPWGGSTSVANCIWSFSLFSLPPAHDTPGLVRRIEWETKKKG